MLEMCRVVVQPDQPEPRLFLHFLRSLAHLAYGGASPRSVTAVFMAGLLSLNGFRPGVRNCAACGAPLTPDEGDAFGFSLTRGGILCRECRKTIVISTDSTCFPTLHGLKACSSHGFPTNKINQRIEFFR